MDAVSSILSDSLAASSHQTRFSTVTMVISKIFYPLLLTTAITSALFFLGPREPQEPSHVLLHENIELLG